MVRKSVQVARDAWQSETANAKRQAGQRGTLPPRESSTPNSSPGQSPQEFFGIDSGEVVRPRAVRFADNAHHDESHSLPPTPSTPPTPGGEKRKRLSMAARVSQKISR